jgi:transposase
MDERHPKRAFLARAGALHSQPERVRAQLFVRHRFFDPLDKVQVKYEMLRAHRVEGEPIVAVAQTFGFSRQTFYTALAGFEAGGVLGLLDEKRGRKGGPVKLTADDIAWITALAQRHPELSGQLIAELLFAERGIAVHRRTVERLLAGKKNR